MKYFVFPATSSVHPCFDNRQVLDKMVRLKKEEPDREWLLIDRNSKGEYRVLAKNLNPMTWIEIALVLIIVVLLVFITLVIAL